MMRLAGRAMRRGGPRAAVALLALALLGTLACERERGTPVIGISYRAGDSAFVRFLQAEVDRTRPEGGADIRVREVGLDPVREDRSLTPLALEVVRATRLAADPDVLVAVGPGGSREALQVAPIHREARLMQIVPTATSRLLGTMGDNVLRLAPDDSVQGAFLGAFADTALHARRVAIFYLPDEYGIGLMSGTAAALEARGIALVDRTPLRPRMDCRQPASARRYDDFAAQLALRGTPDAVVIAARTMESACLIRSLRARWPAVAVLMGDGVFVDGSFFLRAGDSAAGAHLVVYWHPQVATPASAAMVRAHAAARGSAAGAAAGAALRHGDAKFYDAVMLAAAAIREGGATRAGVRRYLLALGRGRPAYAGVTGPITAGPVGEDALLMTRVRGTGTEIVR